MWCGVAWHGVARGAGTGMILLLQEQARQEGGGEGTEGGQGGQGDRDGGGGGGVRRGRLHTYGMEQPTWETVGGTYKIKEANENGHTGWEYHLTDRR